MPPGKATTLDPEYYLVGGFFGKKIGTGKLVVYKFSGDDDMHSWITKRREESVPFIGLVVRSKEKEKPV
jgi:hypothetical protein